MFCDVLCVGKTWQTACYRSAYGRLAASFGSRATEQLPWLVHSALQMPKVYQAGAVSADLR